MSTKAEISARLTAPGAPFALVETLVRGIPMNVYEHAPASLRDLFSALPVPDEVDYLIYRDDVRRFGDFRAEVAGLAHFLAEKGIGKGDRVAVAMRNYPEWVVSFWAIQSLGAVLVAMNAWWTGPELVYALEDSGAKALIVDEERLQRLAGEIERLGLYPVVAVRMPEMPEGIHSYEDVVSGRPTELPDVEIAPEDFATILYTSGTTGRPKGAAHTQRNHISNIWNTMLAGAVSAELAAELAGGEATLAESAPQPSALQTFPYFHIGGMTGLYMSTASGMKTVLQYRWDPEEAVRLIEKHKLRSAGGVPSVVRQLLEAAHAMGTDISSLEGISSGGASVPPDLIRTIGSRFEERVAPANGYGLTETTSAVITNSGADYLAYPDSVGRPVPTADVQVIDAEGLPLGDNEIGELIIRGPNIINGYWNNPTATEEAFRDGWFFTGDLGYRDANGLYYVVDRKKDVIIRGGENIYCAEVEAALLENDLVSDCALVGVPHDRLGEEVGAIVQVRQSGVDAAGLERNLTEELAQKLAKYKIPTRFLFVSQDLPRTATGKLLKRDLKAWFTNENAGAMT